jgi:transposase
MVRASDRLTLGFFQRLITPAAERAFVDGLKALNEGDDSEALVLIDRSASLADAAWLAGMLHLKSENFYQSALRLTGGKGFPECRIYDCWGAGFPWEDAMPAIVLRSDWDAARVRGAAREAADGDQVRRLLAIAAVYEGKRRSEAARAGAMDRQTLRDWVHRFNAAGPAGLIDRKPPGAKAKLTPAQKAELAMLIEAGPEPERDGVVRWRCVDLQKLILERWGVPYHENSVGRLIKRLGFRRLSARPRHLGQDPGAIEAFKKVFPPGWKRLPQRSRPAPR